MRDSDICADIATKCSEPAASSVDTASCLVDYARCFKKTDIILILHLADFVNPEPFQYNFDSIPNTPYENCSKICIVFYCTYFYVKIGPSLVIANYSLSSHGFSVNRTVSSSKGECIPDQKWAFISRHQIYKYTCQNIELSRHL